MKIHRIVSALLALAAMNAAFALSDSVKEVEARVERALKELGGYQADVTIKTDTARFGTAVKEDMTGRIIVAFRENKTLMRMEVSGTRQMTRKDSDRKWELSVLSVSDGQFSYIQKDRPEKRQVTKAEAEDTDKYSGAYHIQKARDNDEVQLELGEDAEVDGKACWCIVVKSRPATPDDNALKLEAFYIWKEHGVVLKTVKFDQNGDAATTMTMSNVAVNPKVDPKMFQYEAPEGVQVIDLTKALKPGQKRGK